MKDSSRDPEVSVILNCRNGEEYLREAIDSVYAQTLGDWEIIFWDNASSDNSSAIAQSYDEKLHYYRSDRMVTLGRARNLAIEKANGKFIAFLDCDDMWCPDKLEKQVLLFSNADVGLAHSNVICFNDKGYAKPKYSKQVPPQGKVFDTLLSGDCICMSSVMIRSEIFKVFNNWFDPRFSVIEDTELFLRISRNWDVAYAPYILCRYRMHENSFSASAPLLFREEEELLIEKFKRIYPEFSENYEMRCREQLLRNCAVVEWKQGNNYAARRKMKSLILRNWKYFLTYLAMYLPYYIPL